MDDLVRWLGEQLDQDERIARAASAPEREGWDPEAYWVAQQQPLQGNGPQRAVVAARFELVSSADNPWNMGRSMAQVTHMAEHDPARVLREIEARRQMLALHEPGEMEYVDGDVCMACDVRGGEPFYPCTTVRLLAAPYSDRPGYREEWRP